MADLEEEEGAAPVLEEVDAVPDLEDVVADLEEEEGAAPVLGEVDAVPVLEEVEVATGLESGLRGVFGIGERGLEFKRSGKKSGKKPPPSLGELDAKPTCYGDT